MRYGILAFLLLLTPAHAVTIHSSSGATAQVAPEAAGRFQCVIGALEREGYPIRFMGGYATHGHVRGSLHYSGRALDVNQVGWGRTTPHMPRNEVALASSCGLVSGAVWRHNDSGHFQLGGYGGSRVAQEGRRQDLASPSPFSFFGIPTVNPPVVRAHPRLTVHRHHHHRHHHARR